ncbi:MFS transporter [Mucilaginibacter calamicampi]|uniref:MFS transporter n=1 Tax=Mucilaginibacter calamicampi TaxID=1302352 RepID=A0ABW2YX27_9SPHI
MAFNKNSLVPVIVGSSIGTIVEWYDFYIFGSLASVIATKFFPQGNATAAFLITLATYAAGFVIRPFGALFFGRLGDLIGRKYTFMVTLLVMGGSTILIGAIPTYQTIGYLAPVLVLILRLLQGLAIGGEYGGAATFVAEHSPVKDRGFWTGWIQVTAVIAFLISLGVVLFIKSVLSPADWETFGWRLPFLASIFLVAISVYIRKNMAESPLFANAKAKGKTSATPLKDTFGNKANLKLILLAVFGVTLGNGVLNGQFFTFIQTFLLKTVYLDFNEVNSILIIAFLIGMPVYVLSAWLSDKTGRKPLILLSLFTAIVGSRPIYEQIYQTVNLKNKTEDISKITVDKKQDGALITTTTRHFFTDKTVYQEVEKVTLNNGKPASTEVLKSITLNKHDKWVLIGYVAILLGIVALAYGPLAAYLVEMFPLKIRYTSISFPYHIGFGVFGGMCMVISTYLVNKATEAGSKDYYLAGLSYPILMMCISFVIGLLYLKEYKEHQGEPRPSSALLIKIKRIMGVVWIALGLLAVYVGIFKLGISKIISGKQDDMIFGIIVTAIITPLAATGLCLLGKYALQGEYDN